MAIRSLRHVNIIDQDFSTEGNIRVIRESTKQFVVDLIKDCANPKLTGGFYKPTVLGLPDYYQKLLLSHVVNADEYESYCKNYLMTQIGVDENSHKMQKLIDMFFDDAQKQLIEESKYTENSIGIKHEDWYVDIDGATYFKGYYYE